MSITFEWYDYEQGIMLNTFSGRWTWQDYFEVNQYGINFGLEAPKRLDVLVDFLEADYAIPSGTVQHLPKIASTVQETNPKWRLTIIITTNPLASTLINLVKPFSSVVRDHYHVVETLEDALALIEADRSANT